MKTALRLTWAIMAHARVITSYQSPCGIGLSTDKRISGVFQTLDQDLILSQNKAFVILDFDLRTGKTI